MCEWIRLAEGLVLLPLVEAAAVPGVFVGCLVSNIMLASFSAFGLIDIIGGSLVSLLAAYLTSKASNKWIGSLPPIILNGFIVSIWVSYFTSVPYIATSIGILLGEAASVLIIGNLVLSAHNKAKSVTSNKL